MKPSLHCRRALLVLLFLAIPCGIVFTKSWATESVALSLAAAVPASTPLVDEGPPSLPPINERSALSASIEKPDPTCNNVALGTLMTCVERYSSGCSMVSSCALIHLDDSPKEEAGSAAGAGAKANPPPALSIAEQRVRMLLRNVQPNDDDGTAAATAAGSDAAAGTAAAPSSSRRTFCTFRNAFVRWNATLHAMMEMCAAKASNVPDSMTDEEMVHECKALKTFVDGELEKVKAGLEPERAAASSGTTGAGATLGSSVSVEDVTTLSQALSQLPIAARQSEEERLMVTVVLRTTLGDGHRPLLAAMNTSKLGQAAQIALHQRLKEDKEAENELLRYGYTAEGQAPRRGGNGVDEAAHAMQQNANWGCSTGDYPVLKIAVVGTLRSGFFHRVQRWMESMCTYCRGTRFLVRVEPFLANRASIVTDEDGADRYDLTESFRSSLLFLPDIVVVDLGVVDAELGGAEVRHDAIVSAMRKLLLSYLNVASHPEVVVLLPHPIFDTKKEPSKRKLRVAGLVVGERSRRMGKVVVPAMRDAVSGLRQEVANATARVHVIDFYTTYLQWLEKAMVAAMRKQGLGILLDQPPSESDRADFEHERHLQGLHLHSAPAQWFLMQQLPDGVTMRKLSNKILSLAVLRGLWGAGATA